MNNKAQSVIVCTLRWIAVPIVAVILFAFGHILIQHTCFHVTSEALYEVSVMSFIMFAACSAGGAFAALIGSCAMAPSHEEKVRKVMTVIILLLLIGNYFTFKPESFDVFINPSGSFVGGVIGAMLYKYIFRE